MTLREVLVRTRGTTPLLVALGIDMLGTGLFMPISLLYFTRVTELSLATVGVLLSVATLVTLPVPILVGYLADRFNPRDVVIVAQLMQAAGFAAYSTVNSRAAIFAVVVLVALGQRVFWSSFFTVVAALPVEGTDNRVQDQRFALVGMVQAAATGLGALITGSLLIAASDRAYQVLALANAVTFLLSAALLLRVPTARRPVEASAAKEAEDAEEQAPGGYRALLRDRPYQLLILFNFVFALCSVWIGIALPVYLVDGLPAPNWLVGPLLAVNTILLATGQSVVVRVVRPLSRVRAMVVAGVAWTLWSVGFALAVQIPTGVLVPYLFIVMLLYVAAELVHAPISNALAAAAAPEQSRGRYLAAFQYCFTFATILAPVMFTTLYSRDRALPWIVLAILAAIATLGMNALERRLPAAAVTGIAVPAEK